MSKFESNGGIIILKNGKSIKIKKSWIENDKIIAVLENKIITINHQDIKELLKPKTFMEQDQISFDNVRKRKPSRDKEFEDNPTTVQLKEMISKTENYCNEIKQKLLKIDKLYKKVTNSKTLHYNSTVKDDHMRFILKSGRCKNHLSHLYHKYGEWNELYHKEKRNNSEFLRSIKR